MPRLPRAILRPSSARAVCLSVARRQRPRPLHRWAAHSFQRQPSCPGPALRAAVAHEQARLSAPANRCRPMARRHLALSSAALDPDLRIWAGARPPTRIVFFGGRPSAAVDRRPGHPLFSLTHGIKRLKLVRPQRGGHAGSRGLMPDARLPREQVGRWGVATMAPADQRPALYGCSIRLFFRPCQHWTQRPVPCELQRGLWQRPKGSTLWDPRLVQTSCAGSS